MESSRDAAAAVPDAVDAVVDAAVQIPVKNTRLRRVKRFVTMTSSRMSHSRRTEISISVSLF